MSGASSPPASVMKSCCQCAAVAAAVPLQASEEPAETKRRPRRVAAEAESYRCARGSVLDEAAVRVLGQEPVELGDGRSVLAQLLQHPSPPISANRRASGPGRRRLDRRRVLLEGARPLRCSLGERREVEGSDRQIVGRRIGGDDPLVQFA